MAERSVSVRLKMVARDYIGEATAAGIATDRLRAKMSGLGSESRRVGTEITATATAISRSTQLIGAGSKVAAVSLGALASAGGVLKLLPPVLSATGAAAGALPGLLGGAAAGMGVLKVATIGVGDALDEVWKTDDPFARLAPSARALVAETARLKPLILGFQQGLQNRALQGSAAMLDRLAAITLPGVASAANHLADDWANAFAEITLAASDVDNLAAFNIMANSADRFFDQITDRIRPAAAAISTLVVAADPVTRAIGDRLVGAIDAFVSRIQGAKASGSLDDFFAAGAENASNLMSILGDIATIFGQVVGAANAQTAGLAGAAQALDAYVSSGRSAADVAGIVDTLTAAYEGLSDVLGPLAGVARDALADPATVQSISQMFQVLAAGSRAVSDLLGILLTLNDATGGLLLSVGALAVVGVKVAGALNLLQASAGRAAVNLTAMGTAGALAGRGLTGLAGIVGKAGLAFVGLEIGAAVLDQFVPAAANVDKLTDAMTRFADTQQVTGELTRLFGENLEGLGLAGTFAADNFLNRFARDTEDLIPGVQQLNELINGESFTGAVADYTALDQALTSYITTTNDAKGASEIWNRVLLESGLNTDDLVKLMPTAAAELGRVNTAAMDGGAAMQSQAERAELLAGSFREAAMQGKDLATTLDILNGKNISAIEGQIQLEEAYDKAKETVDEYGRVTKKGTNEVNLGTEAGRESMAALLGIADGAKQAAVGQEQLDGNTIRATATLNSARDKIVELATQMTGSKAAAEALADRILAIPNKDVRVTAETTAARTNVVGLQQILARTPASKSVNVRALTGDAESRVQAVINALNRVPGSKTIHIRAFADIPAGISLGQLMRRWGGIDKAMAAGGVMSANIYPASSPPLVKFAEPETGGEAYVPRKGDPNRSRMILSEAASWYGMRITPMAAGGVMAAATGLVNVAAADAVNPRATRLDSAEAYIRARDAVTSLNRALKDNGRSFSLSTSKGRENRTAVYSVIKAAQDAAKTKFDETGSVRAANAAYDAHILRLRRTLAQQKINASTIRSLLSVGSRPAYDVASRAPSNSLANIAFARSAVAAAGGIEDLRDKLSLNRASVSLSTPEGRENLIAILDFLGQASGAAQDRFEQTGNAGTATGLYNTYLTQLRAALKANGYSTATINSLVNAYGRITLQRNQRGGVYMAAAGLASLSQPAIYPTGQTMYGFSEPGTGGELFLPRYGDRERGQRLATIGAGWYGGRVTFGGSGGAGTTNHYTTNLNVTPLTANLSITELEGLVRQVDAKNRVGRRN